MPCAVALLAWLDSFAPGWLAVGDIGFLLTKRHAGRAAALRKFGCGNLRQTGRPSLILGQPNLQAKVEASEAFAHAPARRTAVPASTGEAMPVRIQPVT